MFHQGDLNSGITAAINQGKLVACFVRADNNDESRIWEEDWFGQKPRTVSQGEWRPATGDIFATKAVILRIDLGSKESDFLNAFCPIITAPTFVVISNGQVLEKLEAGTGKREFVERVSKALGLEMNVMTLGDFHQMREAHGNRSPEEIADAERMRSFQAAQASKHNADEGAQTAESQTTTLGVATPSSTESTAPAAGSSSANSTQTPSEQLQQEAATVTSLFPDRAQRLEVEKAKREAAEKAERTARANARRKEAGEAHAASEGKGKGKSNESAGKEKARRDWIVQQKQRKDEAKKERDRILSRIEADKMERKSRSQRPSEAPSEPLPASVDAASRRTMGAGGMCSLLIRLFDGSSIKGRFEPSATLAKAVREWIRETTTEQGNANAADIPFTFKQILAPQPSRSIEISEEHQTLSDLGLTPNATLVLAPINDYTEAYSGGGRGYMNTALNAAYSVVGATTNIISTAFSYVPGLGGAASTPVEPTGGDHDLSDSAASMGSIKVKTLADQRAEAAVKQDKKAEFYNGNSSAFEGRKDDDDDGEKS